MGTSLSDALFTQTQQRVLRILFGNPARSFLATEVIRQAAAGRGGVQRELARLVESGLVTLTPIGNQKHYRANPDSPVFEELCAIVMKTSGLAEPLRAALAPLAKRIQLALIYGSVARGEEHARSDVDLLVVADDLPLEKLFARLAPVERKLGRKINPTLYTSEEYQRRRKARNAFLEKILARDHLTLIGTIDADSAA
jgi:predicted nucleotidyltransferase